MNILDNLPQIEGGSEKQRLYAEGLRFQFISYMEEELDPKYYDDATILLEVRNTYKWWIDNAKKLNETAIPKLVSAAKAAITRNGSVEAARNAQKLAGEKQLQKYREYMDAREAWLRDRELMEEAQDFREIPF